MILGQAYKIAAIIGVVTTLLASGYGWYQSSRATKAEKALTAERAKYKAASDLAKTQDQERKLASDTIIKALKEEIQSRDEATKTQNARERALLGRIDSMRSTESSLRTASLNQSAGFAAKLDAATTDVDQLAVCRSLIERNSRVRSGLAAILVQDRAEARRAIDDRQTALGYIEATRARCETAKPINRE